MMAEAAWFEEYLATALWWFDVWHDAWHPDDSPTPRRRESE